MSYYVKAFFWYLKGSSQFGKEGYHHASKNFSEINFSKISGQSFMITGGSSGIGKAVAEALVEKPETTIHIVCRNEKNGNQALEDLKHKKHPSSQAFLHLVDLSEPKEVRKFANSFIESGNKLNVLINNAGVLSNQLEYTTGNLEKSFSLNVLGTIILTISLVPHMITSSNNLCVPRVIFVSSGGMLTQDLDYQHPYSVHNFDGVSAYAQHKRQQVVLGDILAEKFSDVKFFSMHPGWVDTPGVENSLPDFYKNKKGSLRSPSQGADTIVWLAVSKEPLEYPSGSFFFDRRKEHKFLFSYDERYARHIENEYVKNINEILKEQSIDISL